MTEPSYTPSTARIRWDYAELALRHAGKPYEEAFAEFDQWLDQVRADAWDEGFDSAADSIRPDQWPDAWNENRNPYREP